jgi:hypothetical protein
MRNRVIGLLPVAAALVLASCVGFVMPAGRGAELYDIDGYLVARGRVVQPAVAAVSLPVPALADTVESFPAARGMTASAASGPPDLPLVPAPAEISAVDRPVVAMRTAVLILPAPEAPAVPVAALKPVSTAATSSKATPSVPAPAATAPAAATTIAQAVAATNAPAAVRVVYARVGDEIEIVLDGAGYLFLGFADRQTDGMTFKARTVKDAKTSFTFKALKLGTWDLDFQQQDTASGTTRVESVRVMVLEDADFAAAVQRQTSGVTSDVLSDLETGRIEWAEKLVALGKAKQAITEYLKGYREGNADLNDRIAALYAATDAGEAAEKYWKKNVGTAAPYGDRAVLGLARLAVARGDLDGYLTWHRQLLAVTAEPIGDVLVDAALVARAQGDAGLGIDVLAEYARRYPDGGRLDEAAFVTAQLLEAESPFRDLKRSRDLYAALLAQFPESAHAAEAAERLRYLDRHFFTVR